MTLSHFAYHSLYKNSERILEELEFRILRSVPNLIEVISLNPVNSGESNGIIYVSIPVLGDENRNFPCFCLPALPWKSPRRIGSYHTSLERSGRGDCSAVGIEGNGSVMMEKSREQVCQDGS